MSYNTYKEIHYTICPVGNASYIAVNRGWIREKLHVLRINPVQLQTLPQPHWKAHFDYSDPALFREGGNIPPIWAKSNGAEVVLLGAAILAQKQYIITRADSPLHSVEELSQYRLGIPVRSNALIDFHKASAEHGFALVLASQGLTLAQANTVDVVTEGDFHSTPVDQKKKQRHREIQALDDGDVDAIYVKLSLAGQLLETGKYRVVSDLSGDPEHLVPINNEYPNVLTVSRRLAEERPDVVTAYVKEVIRAARWAETHHQEALEHLAEQTHATPVQAAASYATDFHRHLEVNLSHRTLDALEKQKQFLFDHGYIDKDFELADWADSRFLNAALTQLEEDEADQSRSA